MKIGFFLVCAVIIATGSANVSADTFYVDRNHPSAHDSNPGTEGLPWRTIVHAAEVAGAGDTVWIKAGLYEDGDVEVANSGIRGQELVFSAYPGHERQAVIKGGRFFSRGNSHIVVHGLKVLESPSHGFRFEGPLDSSEPAVENITISGNHTYDTCSSGIAVWGVKWGEDPGDYYNIVDVVIEDNLLELGTHGCKNEIITVANGAVNVTVRNNEIRLGDPNMEGGDEGIDFKEGVRDSSIYGNYIHHLSDKAIYIDGGSDPRDPLVSNIHIFNNVMMHLPSSGISIVTEGTGDVDGIYVYNNIVAHVEGDGFIVYDHPGGEEEGGTVKNVHFINNTAVNAGRGGFRVNHERATGIVFRNNIAWENHDYQVRGEAETLIENNLCVDDVCEHREDPGFVDLQNDDFRLSADSPAIDQGLFDGAPDFDNLYTPRPQGGWPDLGAFEFPSNVPETETCTVGVTSVNVDPLKRLGNPGDTVVYKILWTNNDSPGCDASGFDLAVNQLPNGWEGGLSNNHLSVLPGTTGSVLLFVSSSVDAVPGNYPINISLSSPEEPAHSKSITAGYSISDPTEVFKDIIVPTIPVGLSAIQDFKKVSLSWEESTDNVGVAGYRIWRDGVVIAETTVASYEDSDLANNVLYEYAIDAYDKSGNISPMSQTVIAGATKRGRGRRM